MPRIRDLLHADRVYKLMHSGLSFKEAARIDDASAALLIEAWEIATGWQDGDDDDDEDGGTVIMIGVRE